MVLLNNMKLELIFLNKPNLNYCMVAFTLFLMLQGCEADYSSRRTTREQFQVSRKLTEEAPTGQCCSGASCDTGSCMSFVANSAAQCFLLEYPFFQQLSPPGECNATETVLTPTQAPTTPAPTLTAMPTTEEQGNLVDAQIEFPGTVHQTITGLVSNDEIPAYDFPGLSESLQSFVGHATNDNNELLTLEVLEIIIDSQTLANQMLVDEDIDQDTIIWINGVSFSAFCLRGNLMGPTGAAEIIAVASTTAAMGSNYSLSVAADPNEELEERRLMSHEYYTSRFLEESGCSGALDSAKDTFDCDPPAEISVNQGCVDAAQVVFAAAVIAANLDYDDEVAAAKVVFDAAMKALKAKKYIKIAIELAKCAALAAIPFVGKGLAIRCAIKVAAKIAFWYSIKKLAAEAVKDAAIQIAVKNLEAALDAACQALLSALGACLECKTPEPTATPTAATPTIAPEPAPVPAPESEPTAPTSNEDDPIINGFRGQIFKFYGRSDAWYSMLSTNSLQWNQYFYEYDQCSRNIEDKMFITKTALYLPKIDQKILFEITDYSDKSPGCPQDVPNCLGDGTLSIFIDGDEIVKPGLYPLKGEGRIVAHNFDWICAQKPMDHFTELDDEHVLGKLKGRADSKTVEESSGIKNGGRRHRRRRRLSEESSQDRDQNVAISMLIDKTKSNKRGVNEPEQCKQWIQKLSHEKQLFDEPGYWSIIHLETQHLHLRVEYLFVEEDHCYRRHLNTYVEKILPGLFDDGQWGGIAGETRYVKYNEDGFPIKTNRYDILSSDNDEDYEVYGPFGTNFAARKTKETPKFSKHSVETVNSYDDDVFVI